MVCDNLTETQGMDFGKGPMLEVTFDSLAVGSLVGTKAVWKQSYRFHRHTSTIAI
jgi:hypothetical protein